MSALPLVSIGVPTYNRQEKLNSTIAYLTNQSYKNVEIIVSDNHSSDIKVSLFLKQISTEDNRIKFFIQKENIEIEPNFNFVYKQATGDYFMWMADDDIFDHNYIEKCVDYLEKNKDYILCSGTSKYFSNEGQFLFQEKKIQLDYKIPFVRMFVYFIKVRKNGIFYGVHRNNLNFENPIQKHVGGDWNHMARIALLGKIYTLEDVFINRSDDGGSANRQRITTRWNAKGLRKIFFETYTAFQLAYYLFNEPILQKRYNKITRMAIQFLTFLLLNCKFLHNSISRRLK